MLVALSIEPRYASQALGHEPPPLSAAHARFPHTRSGEADEAKMMVSLAAVKALMVEVKAAVDVVSANAHVLVSIISSEKTTVDGLMAMHDASVAAHKQRADAAVACSAAVEQCRALERQKCDLELSLKDAAIAELERKLKSCTEQLSWAHQCMTGDLLELQESAAKLEAEASEAQSEAERLQAETQQKAEALAIMVASRAPRSG